MELTARQLAWLEHRLSNVKESRGEAGEDRHIASSILGKVNGELEYREQQHLNDPPTSD